MAPTREPAPLDADRIVRTLHAHGVECVVVGGIGANLHGAERATKDFDLVAVTNTTTSAAWPRRCASSARTRAPTGTSTRRRSRPRNVSSTRTTSPRPRSPRGTATPGHSTSCATFPPPTASASHTTRWPLDRGEVVHAGTGLVVRIASLDDIVASKEWANRDKDQLALPELYRLQGRGDHRPEPTRQPDERGPRPG